MTRSMTRPDPDQPLDKRITLDELRRTLDLRRREGRTIVFTNGCFDLIHAGHVRYLRAAAGLGDVFILGLNSDESVRRLKGEGRPIYTIDDRAEILSAFPFIDYLIVFETDSVEPLVREIRPDVLAKGGDYQSDDDVVGGAFVKSQGGRVARLAHLPSRSTTDTIKKWSPHR